MYFSPDLVIPFLRSIFAHSKVFWEKPKTLANSILITILSFFVVNCRRPVCVSRCNLAPKGLKTSSSNSRGGGGRGSGGAKVLGKLTVPGRPTSVDYSMARAYCACSGCGWRLFGHFYSRLSFLFSFSLSLGDGPI